MDKGVNSQIAPLGLWHRSGGQAHHLDHMWRKHQRSGEVIGGTQAKLSQVAYMERKSYFARTDREKERL